jgi:hypothetical protein
VERKLTVCGVHVAPQSGRDKLCCVAEVEESHQNRHGRRPIDEDDVIIVGKQRVQMQHVKALEERKS